MKVLVTGSGGFIARHLIKRLLVEGIEVVGIDDYSNSEPDKEWENKFEFHQQNLTNMSPGHGLFHNVDCIFHLAAKARVQPSFTDPKKYYDTNVIGTLNLLEACKQWNIRSFVFSSSSSVYGDAYLRSTGYAEEQTPRPSSPYAMSKVQGEELCRFYKKLYGINCVILRYFNVYGDDQPSSGQYPQMMPTFMDRYRKKEPFLIYGSGDQRRDFTYVDDVVSANIQAMLNTMTIVNNDTLNIGSGTNYSVNEICNLIDPNHPREYLPARNEPKITLADNRNSRTALAWKPTMTVEQWIKNQKV